ncbi:TPA: hypothetical protein DCZ36_01260 [Candidatus Gracilibacteria bacterium]|nr:hypothetical protein [Candidatus Gracilibacteria bacterium]
MQILLIWEFQQRALIRQMLSHINSVMSFSVRGAEMESSMRGMKLVILPIRPKLDGGGMDVTRLVRLYQAVGEVFLVSHEQLSEYKLLL